MRDPFTETSVDNFSAKMSRVKLEGAMSETEEASGGSVTPSINGKMYRLHVTPNLLFHCSETGIKFQVKYPVTIEYELEYGADYMTQIQENGCEIVGPLFRIHAEPGAVSAVYLPHYVSLEDFGGDKSLIKWGHFKDGKMNIKTPDKIEPSYIMLEDPTFSCVAAVVGRSPIWKFRKKYIPFKGKVLLYSRVVSPDDADSMEYRIHLYMIPRDQPVKKLDELKKDFKRIDKPPQTRNSLNTKTNYTVSGKPELELYNEILQLKIHEELENCPFLEINVRGNAPEITLSVLPEGKEDLVWKGKLTKGDLQELKQYFKERKGNALAKARFVDIHREDLILGVPMIEDILDGLRRKKLLTDEQYANVRSRPTPQEKMRELYDFIKSWGPNDKSKFYDILKDKYGSVIKKLEGADG